MLLTSPKWHYVLDETYTSTDALFDALLDKHGIDTPEKKEDFLNDRGAEFYDPFLYNDMRKAVDIIVRAMEDRSRILVTAITTATVLPRHPYLSDTSEAMTSMSDISFRTERNTATDLPTTLSMR